MASSLVGQTGWQLVTCGDSLTCWSLCVQRQEGGSFGRKEGGKGGRLLKVTQWKTQTLTAAFLSAPLSKKGIILCRSLQLSLVPFFRLFFSKRRSVGAYFSQLKVRGIVKFSVFCFLHVVVFDVFSSPPCVSSWLQLEMFGGRKEMESFKKELEEELKLSTEDPRSHAWYHGSLSREVLNIIPFFYSS